MPNSWSESIKNSRFRRAVLWIAVLLVATAFFMPGFFSWLEARPGYLLPDPMLSRLPPMDCSVPIFAISYGLMLYLLVRSIQLPRLLLLFTGSYLVLLWLRLLTLTLTPFDPPHGLVPLTDPVGWLLYGGSVVTKDLFFSGHTSTAILVAFCLPGRRETGVAMLFTGILGLLLLFQHIHYTWDVVAAVPFGWLSFRIANKVIAKLPEV